MTITEKRFNFVMDRKQELSNEVFASLELLATCSAYLPKELREQIWSKIEDYASKDVPNCLDIGRDGTRIWIRRIQ